MISFDFNLKIFFPSLINDNNYFSGFGTRQLGDAKRHLESIFNFFDNQRINYSKIVIPEQIHSINIAVFQSASKKDLERIEETDGIITKEKGVVLTVRTADCLPMVFVDKKAGIIGISHQGWRGSIKRMAQNMIDKIIMLGGMKENIKVALGPSIGDCCYNINEDRYYQFKEEFDGYSDKIFHRRRGEWYLNLGKLNYLLLLEKGMKKENIDFFPFCTQCDKERFFSYRRERKTGKFGEMFSFIIKNI